MSVNVVKLPEESIEAMFVPPYLKYSLPPDSTIENPAVIKFAALVAFVADVADVADVAVAALPPMLRPAAVPVMFVPTKAVGVPRAGVTSVGLVLKTVLPVPVEVATPVPPLATGRIPEKLTASVVRKFVPLLNIATLALESLLQFEGFDL